MSITSEKLKYLEVIQAVVKRMADNSFLLKGWCVTLVSVTVALVNLKSQVQAAGYIVLLPVIVFWGLDAYFLRQERLFRKLYEDEIQDLGRQPSFSLDTEPYSGDVKTWPKTFLAKTIWPYYVSILVPAAFVITFLQPSPPAGPAPSQPKATSDSTMQEGASSVLPKNDRNGNSPAEAAVGTPEVTELGGTPETTPRR